MAKTGFFHHIGSFLLLVATILLIVTCVSAPVVHNISLMKVDLGGRGAQQHTNIAFGTFGFCINNLNGEDSCSGSHVGYSPATVVTELDGTQFSDYAVSTTKALTRAMVLHPIACGLNFIAFLLALGAGIVGSFLASLVALLAFVVTVVVMIIDFVMFSIIKNNVKDANNGSTAEYGTAAWTILVAAICSLLGTVVVFLTCCSARLHKRRNHGVTPVAKTEYVEAPRRRRRWF